MRDYENLVKRCKVMKDYNGEITQEVLQEVFDCVTEAADAIEKLQQENDFLKAMQRQLVRDVPLKDLGQMVYGELRRGGHVGRTGTDA